VRLANKPKHFNKLKPKDLIKTLKSKSKVRTRNLKRGESTSNMKAF
jgi:hypothetical protein